MNKILAVFILAISFGCFFASKIQIIFDKEDGTVGDRSGDYCEYDGDVILPGEVFSKIGKCRELSCDLNLNVQIRPCFLDMTVPSFYEKPDNTKKFPECCGIKKNREIYKQAG